LPEEFRRLPGCFRQVWRSIRMGVVSRRILFFAFAALVALTTACSPRLIPNTTFQDTADNRAILDLMSRYKHAWEAKDAQTIVDMASSRYLDTRESISRETLASELQKDFDRMNKAYLDITVNRIRVDGDKASVDYFFSSNYLLAAVDPHWKVDSDDRRMTLARESGVWHVTYGF
jgi:hypothetical protein